MPTALDIINRSHRIIGVLANGETMPAEEAADALSNLNDMIDMWSTQGLLVPSKVREEFTLVPADFSYTMGVAGQFNTSRPMRIENAAIKDGGVEYEIEIINKDQYAAIQQKSLTSTWPTRIYPEGTNPLETLLLWPVPSSALTLVLYSWKPLSRLALLTTAITLPPGFNEALAFNFAKRQAPEYGKSLSGEALELASSGLANIKRMNTKPIYMDSDCPVGRTRGYSIYSGGYVP